MNTRTAAVQLGPTELRRFRTRHKLRQEDLAQLLGIDRSTVGRWEMGEVSAPPFLNLTLEGLALHLPPYRKNARRPDLPEAEPATSA